MSSLMDAGMAEVAKYTLAGVLILMIVSQPSHISVSQCVTVCHKTHLHSIAQHPVKVGREDAEEEIEMDLVSETFHLSDK